MFKLQFRVIAVFFATLAGASLVFSQVPSKGFELIVDPSYFSPNNDGIQDTAFLSPYLNTQQEVTRWRVIIRNTRGKKIRRLTGAGISAQIKWDGKDKKGRLVPEGDYSSQMTVWGRKFNLSSNVEPIYLDTTPPLTEMTLSTNVLDQNIIGQEFLTFEPEILDESPLSMWQFQVLDVTGRTVYVEWSTHSLQNIIWDGTDSQTGVFVPRGKYRCVLQAWDAAGNQSSPSFLDVIVNVSAREMLEQALEKITVNETDIGLLVQLRIKELFRIKKRKPYLKEEGRNLLQEVALLINAYPDVPVKIEGYSRLFKKSKSDQNLSSRMAWTTYSFLVKQGNVKASRLTVRGRGRSALFDRRSLNLPPLKNGIEITLEGDRGW